MKRSRGRGRRQQNPVNRSYDSNGPDVRVRGTASQVYEKYQALARDAMSAGDRVMAENYQQHAEHYFRILQSFQPQPSEANEAAAENGNDTAHGNNNGFAEDGAAPIDGSAAPNGQDTHGASDNEAPAETNGSEPLVLVRGNDGDDEGKGASKSRRRGPLGRKRKAKPSDTTANADMPDGDGAAAATDTPEGENAVVTD